MDKEACLLIGPEDPKGVQDTWLVLLIHVVLILRQNGFTRVKMIFKSMGDHRKRLEDKIKTACSLQLSFQSLERKFKKACQDEYGLTPPEQGQAWVITIISGKKRVQAIVTNFIDGLRNQLDGVLAPLRKFFISHDWQSWPKDTPKREVLNRLARKIEDLPGVASVFLDSRATNVGMELKCVILIILPHLINSSVTVMSPPGNKIGNQNTINIPVGMFNSKNNKRREDEDEEMRRKRSEEDKKIKDASRKRIQRAFLAMSPAVQEVEGSP